MIVKKITVKDIAILMNIWLIGLLTIPGYGFYYDQDTEQNILFSNIKEYDLHLFGENELYREMDNAGIEIISENVEKDHGIAAYYPVFWLWNVNRASPYACSIIWHIYTFLLVYWGICSLYMLGKQIYCNRIVAIITTFLFF